MSNILINNGHGYHGIPLTETKTYKLWESVGKSLVEAKLSPEQVNQLFANIEQNITAGGANRTVLGKGKDAWTDLKSKIYNSKPMANFAAAYDKAAEKLKQVTGGDDGVFKYVQKYREFAKKHPIIQGAVYAALIAASGVASGGLGGAAALALLKSTDRMLQGDDIRSALWKGAKTGAMAYGASKLGDFIKGKMAGDQLEPITPSSQLQSYDVTAKSGDTLSQLADKHNVSVEELLKANPKITNPDVLLRGQTVHIPPATGSEIYQHGVGTAADTARKVASGEYTPGLGKAAGQAAQHATGHAAQQASDMSDLASTTIDNTLQGRQALLRAFAEKMGMTGGKVSGTLQGGIPTQINGVPVPTELYSPEQLRILKAVRQLNAMSQRESRNLSAKEINKLFENIERRVTLLEGAGWDKFKSGIGQALGGIATGVKTMGHNLTTKVTADKLSSAWKKAGSPDDSTQIFDVLIKYGVAREIIEKTFKAMKIPLPGAKTRTAKPKAAGAAKPVAGAPKPAAAAAKPKAAGAAKPVAGAKKPATAAAQNKAFKRAPGDFAKPVGAKYPVAPNAGNNAPVAGVRTQGGAFAK